MVLLPSNENFATASGIVNIPHLENIYESIMYGAFVGLGGDRGKAILHLQPVQQQDTSTQSAPQPQQYNPFFGRASQPNPVGKIPGTKITHRDVEYTVMSRIKNVPEEDTLGIGELKENQIALTFVIEALDHLGETLSLSFEGRRYEIDATRPFGFSKRRFVLVVCTEINEQDVNTEGTNG